MKQIFLLALAATIVTACGTTKKTEASQVGLVQLHDYYVKSTTKVPEESQYMVFTSRDRFDDVFQANKRAKRPDFGGQQVVAVTGKPTKKIVIYKFSRAEIAGSEMNVYYSVEEKGEHGYSAIPAGIATVPKSESVKRVNFFEDNNKMKTVSVN
jgi:hypothetical protein